MSQYIARSIPTHDVDTQTLTAGLQGTVAKEVDKFCALSLPYLVFLYLDRWGENLQYNETTLPGPASEPVSPSGKVLDWLGW